MKELRSFRLLYMNFTLLSLLLLSANPLNYWQMIIIGVGLIMLVVHYVAFFLEKDEKKENKNDEKK